MRDFIIANSAPFYVAQTAFDGWERMGIVGLSLAATAFIFGYFSKRDADIQIKLEKDRSELAERYAAISARDSEERKRLMEENNQLQQQIVDLLKQQIRGLDRGLDVHVTNAAGDPVPTTSQPIR